MLTKRQRFDKFRKRLVHRLFIRCHNPTALFIGGMQRSGTNLLVDVVNQCRESECYNENDDEAFDECVLRDNQVIRGLIDKSNASIVAFKAICDCQNFGAFLDSFSNMKVIWCIRHYNDCINSNLRRFSEHRRYLYYMLYEPEKAGWRLENVIEEDLKLVEHYYNQDIDDPSARALIWCLRNRLFFQQNLDTHSDILMTSYESLVTTPSAECERVFRFLGIPGNPKAAKMIYGSALKKHPAPRIHGEIQKMCDEIYAQLQQYYESQPL